MIIANNECDYIMKNIKAVNALIESYELAKKRVPVWLSAQLTRRLEQRKNEFPSDKGIKWIVTEEEGEICLTPDICFHDDYYYGIFYGIDSFSWDCLDAEVGMRIYLFYRLPEKTPKNMKQKIADWEENLVELTEKNKPRLLNKYQVSSGEGYLVTYQLNEILNAETLGNDPENAINNTVDSMIRFVEDTHELLVAI